jgi:hypothetical protein
MFAHNITSRPLRCMVAISRCVRSKLTGDFESGSGLPSDSWGTVFDGPSIFLIIALIWQRFISMAVRTRISAFTHLDGSETFWNVTKSSWLFVRQEHPRWTIDLLPDDGFMTKVAHFCLMIYYDRFEQSRCSDCFYEGIDSTLSCAFWYLWNAMIIVHYYLCYYVANRSTCINFVIDLVLIDDNVNIMRWAVAYQWEWQGTW